MRDRRFLRDPWHRRIVDWVLRYLLVKLPDIVLLGIPRERRAQSDDRFHSVRMVARIFAPEEAAEAPADDHNRPVMPEAVDPLTKLVERVGPGSKVPALLPAVDPE